MLLTTFEILLTIVTPLLALYLRGGWPSRTVAGCMVCIAVVWYLTYAPIHELSHGAATLLAGGRVLEVKLIPSFWEGTFAVAWVTTAGLDQPWQQLAMGGARTRSTLPAWPRASRSCGLACPGMPWLSGCCSCC